MPHYISQLDDISDTQNAHNISNESAKHGIAVLDFRKASYHVKSGSNSCIEKSNNSVETDKISKRTKDIRKARMKLNKSVKNESSWGSLDCAESYFNFYHFHPIFGQLVLMITKNIN